MPNFTKDQQQAIDEEGKNIIVSAGAGSGKTAVLSERVLRKLKDGVNINQLLVLTFTNEAAKEMKNRIRKKIEDVPNLQEQLNYIDAAYITTFDSFALSLVKKYHYLLNISNKVNIVDSNIINALKDTELDQIFNDLYESKDSKFLQLIHDFCVKDDKSIKSAIKSISNSLDLKYDKQEFLDSYITKFYDDEYLSNLVFEYEEIIRNKISEISNKMILLENYVTSDYMVKLDESLRDLLGSNNYDEYRIYSQVALPRAYKDMDEEAKIIKDEISTILKDIKKLLSYENKEEIKDTLKLTENYVEVIIDIIKKLDQKINDYKYENDVYEFIDINKMAIQIVKENENVRDELKQYYNEILVDEYQDTNDLQEIFINYIADNNVYMVGDVKQSIYRFRNANPDIFRDKYNNYSINNGGIKIDLLKNFRSREEVIENINLIFNQIMDDALGGADYIKTHQMVFGNTSYNEDGHTGNNNHLEIYKYDADKKYLKEEIEAFIIAHDIKNKVDNKYLIYDKDEKLIRPIQYSDICIIMDRGSSFDIYKEIFGYMQIPLVIYADNKLTNEYDILTLKNIINFIIKISKHEYDTLFKYYFVSISRSFIMNLKDDEIYKIIKENKIKDTDLYKWSYEISSVLDTISNNELIDMIIDKFNVYDRLITLGDVHKSMIRIENLKGIASSLETLGYTPFDFGDYLNQMIDNKVDIKYSTSTDSGDSVKIMNIHKSKGLEFNICYFSGLYKAFNISDLKERFCFDSKYGIITPYYKEGIGSTILKDLQKNKYMLDEISERIRLFYVALTRCKEKMIMILPNVEEEENNNYGGNIVDSRIRIKYRSFADMLNSINSSLSNYVKNIDINDIQITKNYKIRNEKDLKISNFDVDNKGTKVTFTENIVDFKKIEERHASKTITELITKKEHDNMKYGTYMHELLETVDFYNPVVPSEYKTRINNFIKQIDLENVKIYKEHEFIFEYKNCEYHGIIDLLLEYDDKFVIIDYKLKEVSDKNYLKQLEVYKNYLKSISNKQVFTYLYSIIDSRLVKID